MACFEPALDYVVVKAPRWDLQKFRGASLLGAGSAAGPDWSTRPSHEELERLLREPTPDRIFVAAEALRRGCTIEDIHRLSHIDRWFLRRIEHMVEIEHRLHSTRAAACPADLMLEAKRAGFADDRIGELRGTSAAAVCAAREANSIVPCVKQIDTLAGEYPAQTNYLYLTYNGREDDVASPGTETTRYWCWAREPIASAVRSNSTGAP
jgi:hypothetical protein